MKKLRKAGKSVKPAKASKTSKKARTAKGKKKKAAPSRKSPKMKVQCEFCGAGIPMERLEILPNTTTCVQCSQTQPYSEAEVLGLNEADEQEKNRLNVEDFDEPDTDISLPYSESW